MGSIYIIACMCYKRPVFFTRHTLLIILGPLWNNETVRELGTNLLQLAIMQQFSFIFVACQIIILD